MKRNILSAILAVLVFTVCFFPALEGAGKKVEIRLNETLSINGVEVPFPTDIETLKKALGSKYRVTEKDTTIFTWDSAGIMAYRSVRFPDKVDTIILMTSRCPFSQCPLTVYRGVVYNGDEKIDDCGKGSGFLKSGFSGSGDGRYTMTRGGYYARAIEFSGRIEMIEIGEILRD